MTDLAWHDPETVRFLLDQPTWAVVGLSGNPHRTAYRIAELLQARGLADQAVAVGAGGVWFQLGVVDEPALRRTAQAGVPMVMDVCPAIEWSRAR